VIKKSNHTHLIFLRQNIEDVSLSLIAKYCLRNPSPIGEGKIELILIASNIEETHGFYLSLTAHYNEGKTINLKIPHYLVLLIEETSEVQEAPSVPFGFSPH
jgi:hypothetical protein